VTQAPDAGPRQWKLQEKQREFLRASEDEVLYGGAAWGGKTEALLAKMILRREKYPGSAALILRRHLTDLTKEGAMIPRAMEVLKGRAAWKGDEHKFTFHNGSVMKFDFMDHSEDRYRQQGTAWEDIGWEELTQFPNEDDFNYVNAFCRSKIAGCKPLVSATTNPGGLGHGWVKQRYIDPHPLGGSHPITITLADGSKLTRTRRFIPATLEDNPIGMALNPGYEATLLAMGGDMARALRYGDWDIAEGMVFADVWRRDLHVIQPFEIPKDWTRFVSVDYGYMAPFCAHWHARRPDKKRVVTYRELYGPGHHATEQAQMIRAAGKNERISMYVGDPSMWQQRKETVGNSVADEYREGGVPLTKGNNNRQAGINLFRKNLRWIRAKAEHVGDLGELIMPPRWVWTTDCPNAIRTIPNLPRDELNIEDVDCFVAGTMVSTPDGDRAIETLQAGELVDTPIGPCPIIKDGISGDAPVIHVPLSGGQFLEGTLDHKVYVRGHGLVPLSALRKNDTLMQKNIVCHTRNRSTETFMPSWAKGFRRATTFITKMATHPTTSRPTSMFLAPVTTPLSISLPATLTQYRSAVSMSGEGRKEAGGFSAPMPSKCVNDPLNMNWRVDIVESLLEQDILERFSARPGALISTGWRDSLNGFAVSALQRFGRLTRRPQPVRIAAAGHSVGVRRVYNLTVNAAHLYYANGVLVTNTEAEDHPYDCDRYAMMADSYRFSEPTHPPDINVRMEW